MTTRLRGMLYFFQRLAYDFLRPAVAVHIGRVPGINSSLVRMVQYLQRLGLFKHSLSPVLFTIRHTSQDDTGNFQTRSPKVDVFHGGCWYLVHGLVKAASLNDARFINV